MLSMGCVTRRTPAAAKLARASRVGQPAREKMDFAGARCSLKNLHHVGERAFATRQKRPDDRGFEPGSRTIRPQR